jgi:hypothetical protein
MRFRLRTLLIVLAIVPLLTGAWLIWQWQLRETVEMTITKLILIRPVSP